jgi:hypothetical protein
LNQRGTLNPLSFLPLQNFFRKTGKHVGEINQLATEKVSKILAVQRRKV